VYFVLGVRSARGVTTVSAYGVDAKKQTHSAARLIEMESSPRGVVSLKANNVFFYCFETKSNIFGGARDYHMEMYGVSQRKPRDKDEMRGNTHHSERKDGLQYYENAPPAQDAVRALAY
jgi:hypothetical protein